MISENEMNQKSLVSVIIAVFNGEKYLADAIESIIGQTYKNIEIIIIDGNSTDRTVQIIKKYQSQISYWISEPDKGIYDAWNKGLSVAQGEWISFIGSDDMYCPDAIENYINFVNLHELEDTEYISSRVQLITEEKEILRIHGEKWKWDKFKVYMNVAHVGSLHNRKLFDQYGRYNISYKIAADYEFLLRAKNKLNADFLDKVTAQMRIGGASLRNTKVFKESFKAKVNTGGRSLSLCALDYMVARAKYVLRSFQS